jgi:hypothetical protein
VRPIERPPDAVAREVRLAADWRTRSGSEPGEGGGRWGGVTLIGSGACICLLRYQAIFQS